MDREDWDYKTPITRRDDEEDLAPAVAIPFEMKHQIDFSDVDPSLERTDPNYPVKIGITKHRLPGEMMKRILAPAVAIPFEMKHPSPMWIQA